MAFQAFHLHVKAVFSRHFAYRRHWEDGCKRAAQHFISRLWMISAGKPSGFF